MKEVSNMSYLVDHAYVTVPSMNEAIAFKPNFIAASTVFMVP
jgi:hypothetical protein